MDDVKQSLHATRQRPIFFIESVGSATCTVPRADQSQLVRPLRCDDVIRKLTSYLHFAKDFYAEHYKKNNNVNHYAYRQPLANTESIEAIVRRQLRTPFTLLTGLDAKSWTPQKFALLWTLVHNIVSKKDFFVQHAFLAHAEDQPRDVIMQESEDYKYIQKKISPHLDNIPAGVHRLFLQCRIASVLPEQAEHFLLVLDLGDSRDGIVLVRVDVLALYDSSKARLQQQLLAHALHRSDDVDPQLLHADPGQLFVLWKKKSYRFCRYRHRLTRHLDQVLFTYSSSVNRMQSTQIETTLRELILLYQLQHALVSWLNDRQYLSSRTNTVWTLQCWLERRFAKRAHDFLTETYYDESLIREEKHVALFSEYGQQISRFLD